MQNRKTIKDLPEFVAWEIHYNQISGIKFVRILKQENDRLYCAFTDKWGRRYKYFSAITGKEFRPNKDHYLWLTHQKVNRQKYLERCKL